MTTPSENNAESVATALQNIELDLKKAELQKLLQEIENAKPKRRRRIDVNEATGRPEMVRVITTQLRDGQLFYMIAVAPQNERNFENAFNTIMRSVRIND